MGLIVETEICCKIFETAYGWVGVAWSAQGLVAVTLPERTREQAMDDLPAASPDSEMETASDPGELGAKLQRYFCGEAVRFDEPLDPRIGTDFQRRVWRITRSIPRGETLTYGQIAAQASPSGGKAAARAVGQANARNPWAVVVPCHRVVGSDGGLTGYGGGLEMKRRMLAMEGRR